MIPKVSRFRKKRETSPQQMLLVGAFLLGIFGLGIFLVLHNATLYQKRSSLQERAQALQEQIAALELRKKTLAQGIESTNSQEYQEKVLREQGLYKKPGEEVVTILVPEQEKPEFQTEQVSKRSWWNPFTWFKGN